ncbi:hypothetical protein B5M42_016620 [Paenibacillus athensensis]|uniref:Uncharacterized protein n=1 Tax=Paenibacillus athensensis TaxID=1967502 RepID=A0A4Y8PZ41_9BACL|nr:hypothetical protein [Paenibacillus athensensis]MCD1260425.1 hypothetical protein [Paenibacillus athensensis]
MKTKLMVQKMTASALLLCTVAAPLAVSAADSSADSGKTLNVVTRCIGGGEAQASLTWRLPEELGFAPTAATGDGDAVVSIAAEAVADGGDGSGDGKLDVTRAVAPIAAADPLKLAQTYAPETAADWQSTLERYAQAGGGKDRLLADVAVKAEPAAARAAGSGDEGAAPAPAPLDSGSIAVAAPAPAPGSDATAAAPAPAPTPDVNAAEAAPTGVEALTAGPVAQTLPALPALPLNACGPANAGQLDLEAWTSPAPLQAPAELAAPTDADDSPSAVETVEPAAAKGTATLRITHSDDGSGALTIEKTVNGVTTQELPLAPDVTVPVTFTAPVTDLLQAVRLLPSPTAEAPAGVRAEAADAPGEAKAVMFIAAAPSAAELSFLQAKLELARVAPSQDAATIRPALGKLLEQYKLKIAELEAAGK